MSANKQAPNPDELAARLRQDLEFVTRLLSSAKTVEEYAAAANAAASIADAANKACMELDADKKKSEEKTGAPHILSVTNLPDTHDWNWARMKRYLGDDLKLKVAHVEKEVGSSIAALRFFTEDQMEAAKVSLAGRQLGGKALEVHEGELPALAESRAAKRARHEAEEQAGGAKKKQKGKVTSLPAHINEVVCPWWQRPYKEQLVDKYNKVKAALQHVTQEVVRRVKVVHGTAPEWTAAATQAAADGDKSTVTYKTAAPMLGIFRSPQLEGYRNKTEFTIGKDKDGKPCIGFLLGSMADGISAVAPPYEARHTSVQSKAMARAMQDFLENKTQLSVWDKAKVPNDGFWRMMLVREGRTPTFFPSKATPATLEAFDPYSQLVQVEASTTSSPPPGCSSVQSLDQVTEEEQPCPAATEMLVMVQVNSRFEAVVLAPQRMADELTALGAHMRQAAAQQGIHLKHVLVQYHWGTSNAAPADSTIVEVKEEGGLAVLQADQVTGGATNAAADAAPAAADVSPAAHVTDSLCELKFRISPTAFFQVNSSAACVLYRLAGDWAAPSSNAVLLDVCCGTGTIGITLSKRVEKVIGIEILASAVTDARANAALNGCTNIEYINNKAEVALLKVLTDYNRQHPDKEIVAIVDPPRPGLHKSVTKAILGCAAIKKLVYVSCNPDSLGEDMIQLCTPERTPDARRQQQGPSHRPQKQSYTPFVPVKAAAVDIFPHTVHVESVVLLERC